MNKFMIFGSWTGHYIKWDGINELEADQKGFVKKTGEQLKMVALKEKAKPANTLAYVMWNGPEDFVGHIGGGYDDVVAARKEHQDMFDNSSTSNDKDMEDGDIVTPEHIASFTDEPYRPMIINACEMTNIGGTYVWPNSGMVFVKLADDQFRVEEVA